MKILDFDEKKNVLKLKAEIVDDLYILSNFIRKGDLLRARTSRKVKIGGEEGDYARIPMNLEIEVESVSFQEFAQRLRVKGRIIGGPEKFVSIGSYHTLNIEPSNEFEITRPEGFTSEDLEILKESQNRMHIKPIILVAISDDESTVGLLTSTGLKTIKSVYVSTPRKATSVNQDFLLKGLFTRVYNVITELINQYNTNLVICAGPGFAKEHFSKFLKEKIRNAKIYVDTVSNATENGLHEIIRRGIPTRIVQDHKIVEETKAVEEVLMHLGKNDGLVAIGLKETEEALQYGAAEKILLSFTKLNSIDQEERKRILNILKLAKDYRIPILFITNQHPHGEQFERMGGVAAILRYRITR
ncbi:MAG: mRNA surveillance protein pelota [Candidatus Njordarchaeia archaeon]